MQLDRMDMLRKMSEDGHIECEDNGQFFVLKDSGGRIIEFDDPLVPGRILLRFPLADLKDLGQGDLIEGDGHTFRLTPKGVAALDPFTVIRAGN